MRHGLYYSEVPILASLPSSRAKTVPSSSAVPLPRRESEAAAPS